MAQRHFIKQWRQYRNLTQEQLAERIDVTHSTISRLENFRTEYSEGMLAALAEALNASKGQLLEVNPFAADSDFAVQAQLLSEQQRRRAALLLKAIREADTESAA